jgi:hypothetical protein
MKYNEGSKVNGEDKLWFGEYCNEEQRTNQPAKQNFEIIRVENNVRKRRQQEQRKILKLEDEKKHKLFNDVSSRSAKMVTEDLLQVPKSVTLCEKG